MGSTLQFVSTRVLGILVVQPLIRKEKEIIVLTIKLDWVLVNDHSADYQARLDTGNLFPYPTPWSRLC